MQRKDFLKSACTIGVCSCTGIAAIPGSLFAKSKNDEKSDSDWKPGFIQKRFAKVIKNLDSTVTKEQKKKIIEDLGRSCAGENKEYFLKFRGNVTGFFEEIKKDWAEKTEYDEKDGYIRVTGKKMKSCFCPFVDSAVTPKEFCNCTVGWNKEVYGLILDKPVDVKIEESVLWGAEQCTILISIT